MSPGNPRNDLIYKRLTMENTQKKKHIKIFVDKSNRATVVCPSCGHSKQFDMTKFRNINKKLKGRCKCGESFLCTFEFRQYFRKETKLRGHFTFLGDRFQHDVLIKDISRYGLGFSMLSACDIKIGDMLEVTFRLDDANKTVIRKEVEVKSVHDRFVGCQFAGTQWYDKELGFYLMN